MLKAPVSRADCTHCRVVPLRGMTDLVCFVSQGGTQLAAVTALVTSIPGAEMISNVGTELAFRLPMQESAQLPAMLREVRMPAVFLPLVITPSDR